MSALFQPLKIRETNIKNRIVVSPMCQYSATNGFPNDWHFVHYGSRAVGGAGMVIVEATSVSPEGRITPQDLGIWSNEHTASFKKIADFIKSFGTVPCIQLAHAGRKASHEVPWKGGHALTKENGGWQTVAPSPVPFSSDELLPEAMSLDEINQCVLDFEKAAKRALEGGFEAIEIHAAHGYLINEFLSPLSNKRTDEYGGSFENRIKFLLRIAKAIRNLIGEKVPLFVRISATDWIEGGWTLDDSIALATQLKLAGVDLLDCSSGGLSPLQKIQVGPLYQVNFAEQVKQKSGIMTSAVGFITTAIEAEKIITGQQADLVLLARQYLRDPYFPLHAAKELSADIEWPVQYVRAK